MFQRDFIMRAIQQAAEAISRALKLASANQPEQAEQALQEGYNALGIDRELLLMLDPVTLRRQLGEDEKIAMAARLLLAEAEIFHTRGEPRAAARRLRTASRLAEQLPAPDPEFESESKRVAQLLERSPSA